MCGIIGIISAKGIEAKMAMKMNDTLRHRGPDDEGYTFFGQTDLVCLGGGDTPDISFKSEVPFRPTGRIGISGIPQDAYLAMGHRRLSIVDLSPCGHQPMSYTDRYWIVYNGEIYNHIELRAELESEGYGFVSHSDTEVILAAYDRWGVECFKRFNGMWAFALFDTAKQQLTLSRDRFGVKPLYYWVSTEGHAAFASEIKAFTVLPGWQARGNGQRIYDYLAWGVQDHTDETMFAGVFQLRPGYFAQWSLSSLNIRHVVSHPGERLPVDAWYTLAPASFSGTFQDAAEGVRERLFESVKLRLRADVPVGSCLSGGLDSSAIVCIANQLLRRQKADDIQKTFSACSSVKRFDEREHVEAVVGYTGVKAHYIYPDLDELFSSLENIIWHQDEPFNSTSIFAQWSVFRLASESGVKVMLDGQGADEQLAGYHSFFGPLLAGFMRHGALTSLLHEVRAIQNLHGYGVATIGKWLLSNLCPSLIIPGSALFGRIQAASAWLDCMKLGVEQVDPLRSLNARATTVQKFSHAQLTRTNLQKLLHWEDRNSMAHSIESRVPFLDYRLVEYVLGLPDEYKIAAGTTKLVLREAMRGILPESIRMRMDKLGFVTPEEVWIRESKTELFRMKVYESVDQSNGVLKPVVKQIFEEMISGKRRFNFFLWRIICFGVWQRKYNVVIC